MIGIQYTSLLDGCLSRNVLVWLMEMGAIALFQISDMLFIPSFVKTFLNTCCEESTVLDAMRVIQIPSPIPGSLQSHGRTWATAKERGSLMSEFSAMCGSSQCSINDGWFPCRYNSSCYYCFHYF